MKTFIKIFSIVIVILGSFMIVRPDIISNWLEDSLKYDWFYSLAIIFRLVLGSILVLVAKESKFPLFVKVLGYLSIVAAVLFIFIGQEAFQSFFSEFFPYFDGYAPISGVFAMAMGALLFYSFSGKVER